VEDGLWDPISEVTSALLGTFGSLMMGVADLPVEAFHSIKTKIDQTNHHAGLTSLANHSNENLTSTVSLPVTKLEQSKHHNRFHMRSQTSFLSRRISDTDQEIGAPPL
jgi:hypothetical protein